jgi:hypothetical protein
MHRPTAASSAQLSFLAVAYTIATVIGFFGPECAAHADPTSPPAEANGPTAQQTESPSDSTPDPHAQSAIPPDDIGNLVTSLGDDRYAVREKASSELVQKGIAARPQLLAALENPDAEIRFRAKRILSEVVIADFQRRLNAFSSDVDGKLGLSMPGWTAFKQLVGEDRTARDLFVEIQQAQAPLLEAYEQGPKQASEKLREQLAAEPAVINRAVVGALRARRPLIAPSGNSSLGSILAWLFVAGDDAVPISDDIANRIVLLPPSNVFQQAALPKIKQVDPRGEACRKILARWIARDINPIFANYNLISAYMFNLKEGLVPAVAILKNSQLTRDALSRGRAIWVVGKYGSKEHIPLLVPFLKDPLVCLDTGGAGGPAQTQVGDIALAISIKLANQDPKQFGFDAWQNKDQSAMDLRNIGFHSQEQRNAALKKWQDWQDGQKAAAEEASPQKTDDEKSG